MKILAVIYLIVAFTIILLGWYWVWKNEYSEEESNIFFVAMGVTWPIFAVVIPTMVIVALAVSIVRNIADSIRKK